MGHEDKENLSPPTLHPQEKTNILKYRLMPFHKQKTPMNSYIGISGSPFPNLYF